MKKIFFAALMLLMASGAFAQIRVGVKAGGNLSTITKFCNSGNKDWLDKAKMKFGFHAGAFLDFVFNERLSLQPELLYSAQGTDFTAHYSGELHSGCISLGYINVPVLLKINIAEGLSAEIGPQIGFLVSAMDKQFNEGVETYSCDMKKEKVCKDIDVTAVAGLSYTFADNFVVSARYGLGLTKIWTKDDYDPSWNECKNSVIQLSIGYKF